MSIKAKVGQKYKLVDPVGYENHSSYNHSICQCIAKHANIITAKVVNVEGGIQHIEEFSVAGYIATPTELNKFFKEVKPSTKLVDISSGHVPKVGQQYLLCDKAFFADHNSNMAYRQDFANANNIITVKAVSSNNGIFEIEEFANNSTIHNIVGRHELRDFFKLIVLDEEVQDESECAEDSTEYIKVTRKVEVNKTITDANEAAKLISLLKSEFGL